MVVLGASGSVGGSTLEFLNDCPEAGIRLAGVSVHSAVERLRTILRQHRVAHAAITDAAICNAHLSDLRREFPEVEFYSGADGALTMIEAAVAGGADTVLTAMVGAAGIEATMLALRLGVKVALANKETLVTAGPAIQALLRSQAEQGDGSQPVILPVDSEHNAVFQLIHTLRPDHIRRIILTASGGPFRDLAPEALRGVSRAEVLNHPTWNMGPKITVDSAGMINKGLELIEAHFLFSIPYAALDVLVHKHSLVHGMVETRDGGYLLCASRPHMVFPIAHALLFPEPVPLPHAVASAPPAWPGLEFAEVDLARYPGYGLCRQAGEQGGTAPAVLNAANEEAVRLFLDDVIEFTGIPKLIDAVLNRCPLKQGTELEIFLEADRQAREVAREIALVQHG